MFNRILEWVKPEAPEDYGDADPIYKFNAELITGEEVSLEEYSGKVLLVVNTASHCGFTPQYKDLQKLQDKFADKGFTVLAFPSDNFKGQEFGTDEEVKEFCDLKFNISFPLFSKVDVKGDDAHPLWQYLTEKRKNKVASAVPKWNFQKYLINREGYLVDFFYPVTNPYSNIIIRKIQKEL